ncbi:hypothetical protein LEP1GSC132_1392 [Leptospira kirschneri str. 200803703]|uniref:Uncharacterized protein n=3 Tax=Leptospira kirschneri TaxID=29507 RepID=A0A0E2B7H5_9LEPT|nr:hypothetical protein LEP1GSC044_0242 [Leptospira kirschneri serovar Grippotyphosa str. RM52]EKO17272.1 hypothetical protein LEP1GSC081_2321 [Leptospira kirschneri str. H1]EKO52106.1 hypothetical protein LEP1GSC131_4232 [Leptospira kirschneri str. 200802841]EKP04244.1 hypothetical protein LEP1GSC018_3513 [Leptospira kirschneri str. 2008720114]EKQ84695.1 hypothetical protein LEP1GSC064_2898 [Leptospira kirschneri serovar Grippotyphosa str. Moskva]EKR08655.1 hypothetical protein LEP1GSC122_163
MNLFVFCLSAHKSEGSFFRVCLEGNLNLKKERIFYIIN